jgi:hypothetical protein
LPKYRYHALDDEESQLISLAGELRLTSKLLDLIDVLQQRGISLEEVVSSLKEKKILPDMEQLKNQVSDLQRRVSELEGTAPPRRRVRRLAEIDTIICPARPRGFKKVFLGENRWYAVRISAKMIPQIKYIAMYETKPYSGIRWIGYVQEIKPFENSGKFEIILSKKEKLDHPLRLTPEEGKTGVAPVGPRYTKMEFIKKAKKLGDVPSRKSGKHI